MREFKDLHGLCPVVNATDAENAVLRTKHFSIIIEGTTMIWRRVPPGDESARW